MGPVSAEIEIDAPRARVFETLLDLARRPSFTDHFASSFHLTRVESSGIGAGARFRVRRLLGSQWMDTAIVDVEELHRIVEHGRGGRANRIPSTTLWELEVGPGALTQVRVSYWTQPTHPLDRAMEALGASSVWYGRAWRRALERLRDQLESEAPAMAAAAVAGGGAHLVGMP